MASFSHTGDLTGATFGDVSLRDARFVRADLSGARMRSVDVDGAEIDAPWLIDDGGVLLVNGVDVVPLVDAELDRRFPGRSRRRATDPAGLVGAWEALEQTWARTLARAAAMPPGTVDRSVDGEWSLAQTVRHLVMATDTWLGRAVLEQGFEVYSPLGLADDSWAADGRDPDVFAAGTPPWEDVLAVRRERQAQVRDVIAAATPAVLAEPRRNPWGPEHEETVLACLHTILQEEWEHHRYAVRDLDAIEAGLAG